jgi:uncharacterized RDD family membrane protein YckC
MTTDAIQYGGFWRRFAAFWLDFLVLLPLGAVALWGSQHYRLFSAYYALPGTLVGLFYHVYLVRRFGGTPGKLIMRLRIRKVSGELVGYREALLRYAPEFLLGLLMSVALIPPLLQMTDAEFHALSFMERSKHLVDLAPRWFKSVQILQHVWIWSEFIVLLSNRKRRALHDFIAGTVVILDGPGEAMERTPDLPASMFRDDFHPSTASDAGPRPSPLSLFSLGPNATSVYRLLIGLRGCWLLVEWLFDWGARSHVTTFTSTQSFAPLIADGIAVAVWLTLLAGMWFFQRWARVVFVPFSAFAVLSIPFWWHRYSLSSPPSFVPVLGVIMLLATGAILAMSFLPPVRDEFATQQA